MQRNGTSKMRLKYFFLEWRLMWEFLELRKLCSRMISFFRYWWRSMNISRLKKIVIFSAGGWFLTPNVYFGQIKQIFWSYNGHFGCGNIPERHCIMENSVSDSHTGIKSLSNSALALCMLFSFSYLWVADLLQRAIWSDSINILCVCGNSYACVAAGFQYTLSGSDT